MNKKVLIVGGLFLGLVGAFGFFFMKVGQKPAATTANATATTPAAPETPGVSVTTVATSPSALGLPAPPATPATPVTPAPPGAPAKPATAAPALTPPEPPARIAVAVTPASVYDPFSGGPRPKREQTARPITRGGKPIPIAPPKPMYQVALAELPVVDIRHRASIVDYMDSLNAQSATTAGTITPLIGRPVEPPAVPPNAVGPTYTLDQYTDWTYRAQTPDTEPVVLAVDPAGNQVVLMVGDHLGTQRLRVISQNVASFVDETTLRIRTVRLEQEAAP
jgi:hypothetical protein